MEINTQNIVDLLNAMGSKTWVILILGIAYLMIMEHKVIKTHFKSKKRNLKVLMPLWERGKYTILGLLLFFSSWTIITWTSNFMPLQSILEEGKSLSSPLSHWASFSGLISTLGLTLAAWTLMLSAGGRWMVNLAKLLVTISIFYLVFMGFAGVA